MILATLLSIVFMPVMFVAFAILAQTAARLMRGRGKQTTEAGE